MTLPVQTARFYYSAPSPCPYLKGRIERRIFADVSGPRAGEHLDTLTEAGFRRSLGFAYRPACPGCNACVPVRVAVAEFAPAKTWRRVLRANRAIVGAAVPARGSPEQFELFARYQATRHGDGDMARMDYADYRKMIEAGAIDSFVAEFRDPAGVLVAACLADRMTNGLSAVYSFYDPDLARHSLGSFVILWLIEHARAQGLAHVYLGYWIEESRKMAYKARFRPIEALNREGWRPL